MLFECWWAYQTGKILPNCKVGINSLPALVKQRSVFHFQKVFVVPKIHQNFLNIYKKKWILSVLSKNYQIQLLVEFIKKKLSIV